MGSQTRGEAARLPIGALSDRTGCNIETIRYYERIGLMPRTPRSAGGHRLYGEDHVKRMGFIRRSRTLGFTLDQIRTLLELVDGRRYTCARVKRVTVEHLEEIRRKMVDLTKIERALRSMAAECDGGAVPKCAVIDALFDESENVRSEPSSLAVGKRRRESSSSMRGSRSATE
jgi:MerR family transcriptional regulator, mercuric resistance operon regulatory protein